MARKKKQDLPSSTLIVTQANQLVEARYTLPLGEQRLILAMISDIQPKDEDFKEYRIGIAQFSEFLGINRDSAYRECKKITKKLLSRVLEIQEPGILIQTNWVSSAKYIEGEGYVRLCFDPSLKPYLLQLKSRFTSCKLNMLLSFKSMYTMRVYTLLKQYETIGQRDMDMDDLRNTLGLKPGQYKAYADLRRSILEPTQKELKTKADLYFDFEPVKLGRKLVAVHFDIYQQAMPDAQARLTDAQQAMNAELDECMQQVPEVHRSKKTVRITLQRFLKSQGRDYVQRNIGYTNDHASSSYAGYLNQCMKEDWGCDWTPNTSAAAPQKRIGGIPMVEIEQNSRPGESWEQAAGRIARERSLLH